jgi:tetratricopeptide (TPR) repeat protein
VAYLERVLNRWGIRLPKNKVLMLLNLVYELSIVTLNLYFPSKKSRKVPTQKDRDIFNLSRKKGVALVSVNPMRMFAEVIGDIKRILKFDLGKIESGFDTLLSGTGIFASTALSYRLSNKFFEYGERFIDKNNSREFFELIIHKDFHNFLTGKWDQIQELDELLAEENLKVGLFWDVSFIFWVHCYLKTYKGMFNDAYSLLEKFSGIVNDYEYKDGMRFQLINELTTLVEVRKLNDARRPIEKYEFLFKNEADAEEILFLGLKARFQILLNDYDEAEESVRQAEEIYRKHDIVFPIFTEPYFWSRFILDIRLLEESIFKNNKADINKRGKQTYKSCKKLLQNSKKYAGRRSGALGLVARYHWLIGKQNKAISFWKKAIEEGERLGQRPDLARTYMEIGARFLGEKSKHKELNGISAEEYLEKARTMFQEMDLQWDLDELDKISATV